jgi:hypothetical protein
MNRAHVRLALVETIACDLYYAEAHDDNEVGKRAAESSRASIAGVLEAGIRLGFNPTELEVEGAVIAATPHRISALMQERPSDMKGKYS